eukprot:CAMPEP_0178370748 /NCGR_PEP_ID=MMETSP0689_2-20121128/467_1 /TAXON_ID=160604 /ORGANISM="Amphidinium massartii, Strain CS-259" /LENGTH=657 /DNA_ID=CAMNT_0019990589 /DNA_START=46 /DNA_END=2017 /DNA_ORIENTATION=-
MTSLVVFDVLHPETKLWILRCIAGGAEELPVSSLRAMALTSREWYDLACYPQILPFMASLHSRLLTPWGACKRNGSAWGPREPLLHPHRHRDSEPLDEPQELRQFFSACLRSRFQPAQEFLDAGVNDQTWVEDLRNFRQEHFSMDTGVCTPAVEHETGDSPPPCWCAAACVLPQKQVCVTGGGCYNYEFANRQTDFVELFWQQPEVYVFDLASNDGAACIEVEGDKPPVAHTYATAHALLDRRWVFWCGGYYGQAYNSAYALDTEAWRWCKLQNSSGHDPSPRYFAASFRFNGALFAWGGRSTENTYCSDLWRLDASRANQDVVFSEEIRTSGAQPDAKFAATLTNCDDRFAVLYGGGQWVRGGTFRPDVDTYTLSLSSFAWQRLPLDGPQPTPRCQHSALNLGGNLVLILGGYNGSSRKYLGLDDAGILNVRSLQWMRLSKAPASSSSPLRQGSRVQLTSAAAAAFNVEVTRASGTVLRPSALASGADQEPHYDVLLDGTVKAVTLARSALEGQAPSDAGVEQGPDIRSPSANDTEDSDEVEEARDDEYEDAVSDNDEQDAETPENDERETRRRQASAEPDMQAPFWEDAATKTDWIFGQFPAPRAGMAVAESESTDMHAKERSFYIFGGAQYIYQHWYADLYELSFTASQMAGSG